MQETTNQNDQLRATERLIEDICIQRETLRANFTTVRGGMDQYSQSAARMIENADKLLIDIYAMIDRMNGTIEGTRETLRLAHEREGERRTSMTARLAFRAEVQASNVVPLVWPESRPESPPRGDGDAGMEYAKVNM